MCYAAYDLPYLFQLSLWASFVFDESQIARDLCAIVLYIINERGIPTTISWDMYLFVCLTLRSSGGKYFAQQLFRFASWVVRNSEGATSHHQQNSTRRRSNWYGQRLEIRCHGDRSDLFDPLHSVHYRGNDCNSLSSPARHRSVNDCYFLFLLMPQLRRLLKKTKLDSPSTNRLIEK